MLHLLLSGWAFEKMRQMYSSICQMQKRRQKLLKIFFILNPSMILTVETIVKIVQTRYGLYALRCVELIISNPYLSLDHCLK